MDSQSECQTLPLPLNSSPRDKSKRKQHVWPISDQDTCDQFGEDENTQPLKSLESQISPVNESSSSSNYNRPRTVVLTEQEQSEALVESTKSTSTLTLTIPAPKKKREFNLFLPVAVIEKQEKEIPLATDGNSQKKNKSNVFTFYDNFHEYTVFCDVAMKKCSRESQQDRFSAINPLDSRTSNDSFFAVFDGHGTSDIADTLKEHLHRYILESDHYPINIERAVKESFSRIDSEILAKQKEKTICSGGSTALCCLIREDSLYVINCGDSSCVLVDDTYSVKFLNKLHKPSDKEEQQRMLSQNTLFTQSRVIGTLAVTRAIGDYQHKEYIISEPDISVYPIDHTSKYCFLGTDGFWDIIDYEKDLPGLLQQRDMEVLGESNYSSEEAKEKERPPMTILGLKDLSTFLVEHASTRTTSQKKDNMTLLAIDLAYFYRQYIEMSKQPAVQDLLFDESEYSRPAASSIELIANQQSSQSMMMQQQQSCKSTSGNCNNNNNNSSSNNTININSNNNNLIVCSKSQFMINTQISSFLFQAKSPHSVGRSANEIKQSQQQQQEQQRVATELVKSHTSNNNLTGGGALTCQKLMQKRSFFTFDDDMSMLSTAQSKNFGSQNAFTFLNQGSLLLEEKDPDDVSHSNIPECGDANEEPTSEMPAIAAVTPSAISLHLRKQDEAEQNAGQSVQQPALSAVKRQKPNLFFEF